MRTKSPTSGLRHPPWTPTANVRNGLPLASHPLSCPNMLPSTTTNHNAKLLCQTSKEVPHAGAALRHPAWTPTANVRNGLPLASHPLSCPNMLPSTTTHHNAKLLCQTSKEVPHAGAALRHPAWTPTANVRNGLPLASHPLSCPNMLPSTTTNHNAKLLCQTSKEVPHAGAALRHPAWTPTANVRNGLPLASHPLSCPHMLPSTTTHHNAKLLCQTSKEVPHAGAALRHPAWTPTANVRNGLPLASHPLSCPHAPKHHNASQRQAAVSDI